MTDLPADLTVADRALYVESADALVVADVHVGRDEASRVELPLGEREDLLDRLSALLDGFDPGTVVVAGDLLHSFDRLPQRVTDAVSDLREAVGDAGAELVVAPGNHDTMLEGVVVGPTDPAYRLADGTTVVCHGHEAPEVDAERYLIGHAHPALRIEGQKHPCFLYGPGVYRGADVVVLPAFNRLARGAVVNGMVGADFQSPLISRVDRFRPVVYDEDGDEALAFPPLGDLREYL
ncbi:metallophosphoesterase [Halobacteriales archaeon QS_1_68_20]|nr:MAG: metallophosphoesterase [Halobacteriales archaeon QS_1_68_20]